MTATEHAGAPGALALVRAYAATDARILLRMRTPLIFMFAVPAMLALLLGPALGASSDGSGGTIIGLGVLFSFVTINYSGNALFQEFYSGTWVRQALHRPPRAAFVVGKAIPVAALGLLQLALFGTAAFLVYGLPLHGSLLQLAVIAVGLICVGSSLGVLLYTVTLSVPSFQGLAYLFLLAMGSVGGTLVPTERLPVISQFVGYATPHYWALRAFRESTVGGGSWVPTVQAFGLLAGLVVVLLGLAFLRLDYTKEKLPLT